MARSTPDTPAETQNDHQLQSQDTLAATQTQQTSANARPQHLQQRPSGMRSAISRMTGRSDTANDTRPENGRNNTTSTSRTATTRMRRTGTSGTNKTWGLHDVGDRAEKKQEQTVDVDNDYFALNPWYNQQKARPVFGLAAPLPRTVRKSMWWGRGDLRKSLYKFDEQQDEDGIDGSEIHDFQKDFGDTGNDMDDTSVPLDSDHHTHQSHDPAYIQTTIEGRKVNMRRVPTAEADQVRRDSAALDAPIDSNAESEGRNRAPVNEHGLTYNDESGGRQGRHQFGLAEGLPPLQELDTHKTTQTEREKKEIQNREHEVENEYYDQYRNPIAKFRAQYPQAPAEFLATFVYLLLGICVNLSVATSQESTGSFETQAWGWGFAVMIGIYLAGGVSGAHLSPTISLSLTVYRGFPWRMAFVYICMQMLAGLAAGALAYGLYYDAIMAVDPGLTVEMTGKALFPKGPSFSTASGFFNDFVYMAIWVCVAFALGDDQNSPPGQGMTALIFGLNGFLTMVALGYNTGLGISPARDLGPRLIALWAGYSDAFATGYWAYGPWGASIAGALFGGLMYDLFVFVGGESPVNYRWPQPGDINWKAKSKKDRAKDKIQQVA